MNEPIKIKLGDVYIVASINPSPDANHQFPDEMNITIESENGEVLQDICTVRQHQHWNQTQKEGLVAKTDTDFVDCLVWTDSDDEDWTKKFTIGVRQPEEGSDDTDD